MKGGGNPTCGIRHQGNELPHKLMLDLEETQKKAREAVKQRS